MGHTSYMQIHYSVQNGGDGSAYPIFLATPELARWDQEHMDEGWGEPCYGDLTVEPGFEGMIICPDMMDAVGYWLQRTEDEEYEPWDQRDEFLAAFFPDGLPTFEVRIREAGIYYDIFVDNLMKGYRFGWNQGLKEPEITEAGRAALEQRLNA